MCHLWGACPIFCPYCQKNAWRSYSQWKYHWKVPSYKWLYLTRFRNGSPHIHWPMSLIWPSLSIRAIFTWEGHIRIYCIRFGWGTMSMWIYWGGGGKLGLELWRQWQTTEQRTGWTCIFGICPSFLLFRGGWRIRLSVLVYFTFIILSFTKKRS